MKNTVVFKYMLLPISNTILSNILIDENNILTYAYVVNGHWDLVRQDDGRYTAGNSKHKNTYIVKELPHYKTILYQDLIPCDEDGMPLDENVVELEIKHKSFPFQPKPSLTGMYQQITECQQNGSGDNLEYLNHIFNQMLTHTEKDMDDLTRPFNAF